MLRLLEMSSSSKGASSDGEVDSEASSDGEVDYSESSVKSEGISYQFENASDASDEDSSNSSSTENKSMERSTESDSTVESVDSTVNSELRVPLERYLWGWTTGTHP